jgi:hypothetical protein
MLSFKGSKIKCWTSSKNTKRIPKPYPEKIIRRKKLYARYHLAWRTWASSTNQHPYPEKFPSCIAQLQRYYKWRNKREPIKSIKIKLGILHEGYWQKIMQVEPSARLWLSLKGLFLGLQVKHDTSSHPKNKICMKLEPMLSFKGVTTSNQGEMKKLLCYLDFK